MDIDQLISIDGSLEDEGNKKAQYPEFYEEIDMLCPIVLTTGITFRDHHVFRKTLKKYSIQIIFDFKYIRMISIKYNQIYKKL